MTAVRLVQGDSLAVLRTLPDASVDAVVTDPPYGLTELSRTLVETALRAWLSGDRDHVPDGRGFMGRSWDAFVPPPAIWDECFRVLKPGGHLVAFAGSRTYDVMGLSIRLAGFEVRDGLQWLYGSGFPKGLDVGKAIDRAAGAVREVVGTMSAGQSSLQRVSRVEQGYRDHLTAVTPEAIPVTAPATEDAARWDGWNTSLKPAHEPIVLARKPLVGTVAANVLEHGVGALNIGACRVEHASPGDLAESQAKNPGRTDTATSGVYGADRPQQSVNVTGRWPTNVLLSHGPACNGQCAPGCPVAELDAQSGVTTSRTGDRRAPKFAGVLGAYAGDEPDPRMGHADTGGASRFFPSFRYQAKAPSSERPKVDGKGFPTVKPVALMSWVVRLVTPPGGTVLDPFTGSGTTGQAAQAEGMSSILIDRDTRWASARLDLPAEDFAPETEPKEDPMPQVAAAPGMQIENVTAQPRNPGGKSVDDWEDFERDQWGRPLMIRAELQPDGTWIVPRDAAGNVVRELVPFRRSSSLGGAIEYQENLGRWRALVACFGIVRSPKLAKRMRAIPDYATREYKDEGYEVVKLAQEFAEIHSAADHGTALHTLAVRVARGEADVTVDEDDVPAIEAFRTAITRFEVISCEQRVICDEAQAAGRYDLLVTPVRPIPVTDKRGKVVDVILPGELIVVDVKTSATADYFGPKFAVQLWTYDRGRVYDRETGQRSEQGPREQGANHRWALILHMPSGGDSAQWYWIDLRQAESLVHLANEVLAGRNLGKRIIGCADLDAQIPADLLEQATGSIQVGADALQEALAVEVERRAAEVVEREIVGDLDKFSPAGLAAALHPLDVAAEAERTGESELEIEARLTGHRVSEFSPLDAQAGGSGFTDRPMPSAGAPPVREDLAQHLQSLERDRVITRTIKDARDVDTLVRVYDRLVELDLWPGPWKSLLVEARRDIQSGRRFARATGPTE